MGSAAIAAEPIFSPFGVERSRFYPYGYGFAIECSLQEKQLLERKYSGQCEKLEPCPTLAVVRCAQLKRRMRAVRARRHAQSAAEEDALLSVTLYTLESVRLVLLLGLYSVYRRDIFAAARNHNSCCTASLRSSNFRPWQVRERSVPGASALAAPSVAVPIIVATPVLFILARR